jgi:hypothetical protein
MIRTPVFYFALLAVLIVFPCTVAQAQSVVPSANATVEGDTSVSALNNSAQTYQWVYGASNIPFPSGTVITSLAYRLDGGQPTGPSGSRSISTYQITLSPSNFAPGSLSTTFADNIGAGSVVVHSGGVSLSANSFTGGAGANPFGPAINFDTPYTYTGGALLITVTHTGTGNADIILDAQSNSVSTPVQLLSASNFNASSGTLSGFAPVVQLGTTPVPEPSSMLLVGACVMGGVCWRRRIGCSKPRSCW